jgi:hypothetical protein
MLKKYKVKAYSMCDDQNLQFHKKDILKTKKGESERFKMKFRSGGDVK